MRGIDFSEVKPLFVTFLAVGYLWLGSVLLIVWLYARHLLKDRRKGKTSSGQWWLSLTRFSPLYDETAEDVDLLRSHARWAGCCALMFLVGSAVCWALLLWWD